MIKHYVARSPYVNIFVAFRHDNYDANSMIFHVIFLWLKDCGFAY